jgi:hypothetical protein
MMTCRALPVVMMFGLVLAAAPARGATVWVEAENPDPPAGAMSRHPWWYDKVKTDRLSGGDWISNFSADKEGTARYTFTVAEQGDYTFWLRANPVGTRLAYSLDGGPEREVDFTNAIDQENVAGDGKPDLRFIAWTNVGRAKLAAGKHTIAFRMHSENHHHGAIDCFFFTTESVTPRGKDKPGAGTARPTASASADGWPFEPAGDKFAADCLLDLRSMNESVAGEHGMIRLSADGASFARGDGRPIRFWAVNAGGQTSAEDVDTQVRFLAKKGVNMIRLHRSVPSAKEGSKITDVDDGEIDTIFKYVAAAKKNGVYVTLSPYWAHLRAPASWGIEDYAGQELWGVLFFNDDLKAAYKAWTTQLYTRVNPYTGVALKDEPAIALIQVANEDSLLFWTFQGIKPAQMKILGRKYGQWLAKKYGSVEKALAAWGGEAARGDDSAAGVVGLYPTYEMLQDAGGNKGRRLADQTQFLGEIQRDFYAEMEAHYRGLGCGQLVNAMNWRSADPVKLDDLERWTYAATDVSATNSYFGGLHVGKNNGYRIDPGHYLTNKSALHDPLDLTANLKQTAGGPMLVTEAAWTHPNLYQSEGPFLMAAYQSLTGVDATYWFSAGQKQWLLDPRRTFWKVGDSYALDKWSIDTPTCVGMFPAFAIAFRQNLIRQADRPAVYEERSMQDLYERKVPIISEGGKFDPNRDAGSFSPRSKIRQEVDRLAFLVGPVVVKFGGDPANSRTVDLSKYIDREKGLVRSLTGQIETDWKRGVCTVNAEKFAGVCGFLKDAGGGHRPFELGVVSVHSDNDYAAIAVVAMDDAPLATSKQILVQVGTTARLTGWETRAATFKAEGGGRGAEVNGEEIVNTGSPPWRVAATRATITLKNAGIRKATRLDPNGYVAQDVPVKRAGDVVTVELPKDTMYLVLR